MPSEWFPWVLMAGLLWAAFMTYWELHRDAKHVPSLRRVKAGLRQLADEAKTLVAEKTWSESTLNEFRTRAERFVACHLGLPKANVLKRDIINNQLAFPSPNEVPKEGHALNAAGGWLWAIANEITEVDLKQ